MHPDTIRESLERQLHDLETSNHAGAGHLSHQVQAVQLRARLQSVDRLACELENVTVAVPRFAAYTTEQLRQFADRLADDLSYLEERLVVLEVDRLANHVQLRSGQPRQEAERRSYFEVYVSRQGIDLSRYQKEPGSERERIPAVLSRDTVCRLCVDLLTATQE